MKKFAHLYQLNKEIELLENAGKLRSAEILHKKFIKEAQYMMPMMNPMMMMPQMMPFLNPMMMARPGVTVTPASVARPAAPAPAPVQGQGQGQVAPPGQTPPPGQVQPPTAPPTNKEIKPPYTGTQPPPPPPPQGQTQYGDPRAKDQELQYLMNEKKRLEEMGANDPNSPYYKQYQTILSMIQRNQGGSVIRG